MAGKPDPRPRPSRRRTRRARVSAAKLNDEFTRLQWQRDVVDVGICAVCRHGRKLVGPIRGHHIVYQQWIKRRAATVAHQQGLDPLAEKALLVAWLWDRRNGLRVCDGCHTAHHSGAKKIPRALIPPAAWEFARELGLDYRLERAYP